MTAELDRTRLDLELQPFPVTRGRCDAGQVNGCISRHVVPRFKIAPQVAAQFHWNPETYDEEIRAELPLYEELQEASIAAIPFAPARVLELGFGTAETTRRIWERFPQARITGIDSSPEMVFKARRLGWEEMRLGRIEDPLPDGPWDLVISVLAVHHLADDGKRDLFRRATAADQAEWCGGEVVWEQGDFAVVRAVYDE
jgi:SAM-dependent methyltransferase